MMNTATALGRNLSSNLWNRTPGAQGAALPPALANLPASPVQQAPESPPDIQPSDVFVTNDTPEQTQQNLNPVFSALRSQSGLGPSASDQQVLDNFRTVIIPAGLEQLSQRITELEQAEATPDNRLALENARASLALYQQANQMLLDSPLLAPPPAALSPDDISAAVQTAIIPAQNRDSYRAGLYDTYIETPRSPTTLFNQRKSALDAQIAVLQDAAVGASPEEAAKYPRIQNLLQELSDLYGSFPGYTKTGDAFMQDVESLTQRITAVTAALNAASGDLSEGDAAAIDAQLQDFSTLATELAIMPNRPGNLGYSINFTYKRVGEIQAGKRTRETPDISGALTSYVNDRKDMAVFVSRFGDLRAQIRSGNLRGQDAIDLAMAQIPGTSQAFKTVFTQLIRAELELAEAARLRASARADVAEGNRQAAQGEKNVSAARTSNATGRQAGAQAREAVDRDDYDGARGFNGQAVTAQQQGAGYLGQARGNLQAAEGFQASARRKADTADRLDASADRRADSAALSAFAPDFQEPIQSTRQGVARSRADGASLQGEVGALGARTAALRSDIAEVAAENAQLETDNTADATYIDEQEAAYLAEQEAANARTQELLAASILSGGANTKFEETFWVKLGSGAKVGEAGATIRGQVKVGVSGEIKADGSVALDVAIDVGASAELNVFFAELKGAVEFGGSYGLRFSPENAVEFTRLLNDMVTVVGNEGISMNAEQARARLFRFLEANSRTEARVTFSGSGSVGSGNDKYGLGAKVQLSRVVLNSSVDSNGNQRFDESDEVTTRTSYEAALTVDVTLEGHKYTGKIVGIYDADTGRVKAPTLTVDSLGRTLPAGVTERIIAQAQAQGVVDPAVRGQAVAASLAQAQSSAPPPPVGTRTTQPLSRVVVNFDSGDLTYTHGTRVSHETKGELGTSSYQSAGYIERGTQAKVNIYGR